MCHMRRGMPAVVLSVLGLSAPAAVRPVPRGAIVAETEPVAHQDAARSRAAFREAYRVFVHPRCINCHPAGEAPLQGDDGRPHAQNVKRGPDGKGKFALRCASCHQRENLPGENMPPGNPNWHLPPPEMPMVFEGKSARELALQLKDARQNGGKSLEEILRHVAEDSLVKGCWSPGEGRTKPPLEHAAFVRAVKRWIDEGAAIPE